MKKGLMAAWSLILLTTACSPQAASVVSLPGADVTAVRLNSANVIELDEGQRSLKVNVSLDAVAPPSFGIRGITQPTDYLVSHVSSILLQLYTCTTTANAEATDPGAACTPTGSAVTKTISPALDTNNNSITFNINKLGANKLYTVKAVARNGSGTSINSAAVSGNGFPAINPTPSKREYISTSANGTISLVNDATVSGTSSSVTITATANSQIDIKIKLADSTGGSVSSNLVEIEDGAVSSPGEEITAL